MPHLEVQNNARLGIREAGGSPTPPAAWRARLDLGGAVEGTMTYGRLAQAMGYPDRQAGITLARQLGIIGEYCKMNDIPPLNAIVVNQETGEPGSGVVLRDAGTSGRSRRRSCGKTGSATASRCSPPRPLDRVSRRPSRPAPEARDPAAC
jgi:hypothetical protein